MRVREFFTLRSGDFGVLWKYQLMLGVLLVLSGVLITIFPEILIALVAAAVIMAGVGLIGSAWWLRRLEQRSRGLSVIDTLEW